MSATPTPYERQANFTSFEASNPSKPKPGASLDAEFNAVQTALDTTQSRLAEIQRDDGALANGSVSFDTLDEELQTAIAAVQGDVAAIDEAVANASASAATALTSRTDAQTYMNSALASAQAANTSETNAAGSATASASSATAAAGSATAASTSASAAAAQAAINMPTGGVIPFAGTAAPSGWLLCAGQEVSRTTYAALDAVIGTTYGAYTNGSGGAGTTHFRVPDLRGRVPAGKDNMGGSAASRLTNSGTGNPGVDGATLGASGGADRHTLTTAQLPAHNHSLGAQFPLNDGAGYSTMGSGAVSVSRSSTSTANAGSDQAHPNVQPTLVLNYIIKA